MPSRKKRALISDVHSNTEALAAVLEDAHENNCDEILCLGDLIGYGPEPRQVMKEAIRTFRFTLLGNHEEAVLYEPVGFNWKAEASAFWTRDQLRSRRYPKAQTSKLWSYLEHMPRYIEEKDALYVHASPLDPTKEYIMPEACYNRELMRNVFRRIRRISFGGHTHLPGIFFPNKPFRAQEEFNGRINVSRGKYFVNIGSVGQPRDGDTRACYVIFDGPTIQFRRVTYNYRKTARKIKRIKRLPNALGHRLSLGL